MISGIYKILNIKTNKFYIGSAINLKQRWLSHVGSLRRKNHKNILLQNSWNKHGEEQFTFEVIEFCEIEQLIEREQFWIDLYCATERGYNLNPTAGSNLGRKFSDDFKRKQSILKKGRKLSKEAIDKMKLRVYSEETKLKISNTQKGKLKTIETKLRMSKARIGIIFSETHRKNISLSNKGISRNRKSDKWPHADGAKCKCENCRNQRIAILNQYKFSRKILEQYSIEAI